MTTGNRKTHDFCWLNLITPDAQKAKAFYAKLFRWTYGEMPGVPGGEIIIANGQTAGALMDLTASKMPPGTPAVIGVMVKVESADQTVARANALGGKAEPAFDVMENGRMAMVQDPNGAMLGLWQPKSKQGFDVDSRAHGAPTWFETLTTDAPKAIEFYSKLFGWKAVEQHPVPGMTYTLFQLGAEPVAGAMQMTKDMGNVPPHWATSFAVENADETARLAVELGAKLCMPVQEIPTVGRFAMIISPQGVPFNVLQWA